MCKLPSRRSSQTTSHTIKFPLFWASQSLELFLWKAVFFICWEHVCCYRGCLICLFWSDILISKLIFLLCCSFCTAKASSLCACNTFSLNCSAMVARLTCRSWRLPFATRDCVCELNVLGQTILAILAVIKNLHPLLMMFFHCVKTFKQIDLPDVCTTMKALGKMLNIWHNVTKHFNRKQNARIGETIFHLSLTKVVLILDT